MPRQPLSRHVRSRPARAAAVATLAALLAGATPAPTLPATTAPTSDPVPTPASTPIPKPDAPVLLPLEEDSTPPTAAGIAAAIGPLLGAQGLGGVVSASVVDVRTGQVLLRSAGRIPRVPASVAKLATAAAALRTLGPEATLPTRVVRGVPGTLVLVGGGDSTLTVAPAAGYPRWASLTALADATAAALKPSSAATPDAATPAAQPYTLTVDDTLFTGRSIATTWKPAYVPDGEVAPVSALMADHALLRPGTRNDARAGDPALRAGEQLAELLRARGVPVTGAVTRAGSLALGEQLAEVRSPPVATLVEDMLVSSDNDVAEALGRLAARAAGLPATFEGAGQVATKEVGLAVRAAGAPPQEALGVSLLDGSGLSRGSRLTSDATALLLADAALPDAGRPLGALVSGLPVAGFTGTLAARFSRGDRGSGVVRAKTGSLSGVTSLAGQVVDTRGRLLTFAVLADRVSDPNAARNALDRVATALGRCGCR